MVRIQLIADKSINVKCNIKEFLMLLNNNHLFLELIRTDNKKVLIQKSKIIFITEI